MSDTPTSDLIAAIPLPTLVVAPSERIANANTDACALLGQQIVGRHFATILRQPDVATAIEATLRDGKPRQTRFLANDGAQDTTFDVSCRPIAATGACLVSFRDVTDMQQAGQMRRDFVANVSHELRTPLTALMGFIETLRGAAADDPAARDRFLGIMQDESDRMNRLIGDLLSLSRVEDQERIRPSTPVDLTGQIASVLATLKPLAEQAGVRFAVTQPNDAVIIPGDADQLKQVFTNLIENAIKYGGTGGVVEIAITTSDRDPALRAPAARVKVIDKGPGIDPLHLPRLTERFYRADSHRSRMLGGTGLGLAIVKHIINRHRGRLRVESELGHGATFTVILPA
ncbi:ATP-binding protein [Arenibacterium sp. CAU 1754]